MFVVDDYIFRALRLTPVTSGKNNIRGSFLLASLGASRALSLYFYWPFLAASIA
jgi:hypothetical protein